MPLARFCSKVAGVPVITALEIRFAAKAMCASLLVSEPSGIVTLTLPLNTQWLSLKSRPVAVPVSASIASPPCAMRTP